MVFVANNNNGIGALNPGGSPSRLDDLNPEAIDRIEILKGAAAATLYGTEASNGVITDLYEGRVLFGASYVSISRSARVLLPSRVMCTKIR